MRKLIDDAMAYGIRLKQCSEAQLSERGVALTALGQRLEDAWRGSDTGAVAALRSELCQLTRQIAAELDRSVGVTFHPVTAAKEVGWVLIFGTAEQQPVPLRAEQLIWVAEAACAA